MKTRSTGIEYLTDLLIHQPEKLVMIGTGMQSVEMRRYFSEELRLRLDLIPGFSSATVPSNKKLYLVCASPKEDVLAALHHRGVTEDKIIVWEDFKVELHNNPGDPYIALALESYTHEPVTLKPYDEEKASIAQMISLAQKNFLRMVSKHSECHRPCYSAIEAIAQSYLKLRYIWWKEIKKEPSKKKLLFPSAGRCGGVSITTVLHRHEVINLNVDHEGFAYEIYFLIKSFHKREISEAPLATILSIMLECSHAAGGNPFCFLMPYLDRVPWFECFMLKVDRDLKEHQESIIYRNFHYTEHDYIKNRVTASDWNEMNRNHWDKISLKSKVAWYIKKTNSEIEKGFQACKYIKRVDLGALESGLNTTLTQIGLPKINKMVHVNTIPKDRIYSFEERVNLLKKSMDDFFLPK